MFLKIKLMTVVLKL